VSSQQAKSGPFALSIFHSKIVIVFLREKLNVPPTSYDKQTLYSYDLM